MERTIGEELLPSFEAFPMLPKVPLHDVIVIKVDKPRIIISILEFFFI
jgi:hypothetical protein